MPQFLDHSKEYIWHIAAYGKFLSHSEIAITKNNNFRGAGGIFSCERSHHKKFSRHLE